MIDGRVDPDSRSDGYHHHIFVYSQALGDKTASGLQS